MPLLIGSAMSQAFLASDARGLANQEYWAIVEIFEELAGVTGTAGRPAAPACSPTAPSCS